MFVASIFVISLKGLDNVTKHTSFERNFNLVSVDVVPVENNSLLTMLSVERLFHMLGFKVWNGLFYCLSRGSNKYDAQ